MVSPRPAHPAPWQGHAISQQSIRQASISGWFRFPLAFSFRNAHSQLVLLCTCLGDAEPPLDASGPYNPLLLSGPYQPCCCQPCINPCCCLQANLQGLWRQLMRVMRISARLVGTSGSHSNPPRCTAPAVASASSETRCESPCS